MYFFRMSFGKISTKDVHTFQVIFLLFWQYNLHLVVSVLLFFFVFLYCHIMCIYILSSVLWCLLQFPHKNHRRMRHGFRFLLPPFLYYPPPFFFQNFHNYSFFKIFIIIRFSSFDNISRRHTSWIIRVFCVHSFSSNYSIGLHFRAQVRVS